MKYKDMEWLDYRIREIGNEDEKNLTEMEGLNSKNIY